MADPRTSLLTLALAAGIDNVSDAELVPAGMLTQARNVRLSKVPGRVVKAPGRTTALAAQASRMVAAIPLANGDATAVICAAPETSKVVRGVAAARLPCMTESATASVGQGGMVPAQVTRSALVPGYWGGWSSLSSASWQGNTLFAWIAQDIGTPPGVMVSGIDATGAVSVPPALVLPNAGSMNPLGFCAVTSHGSTLLLWWADSSTGPLNVSPISFVNGVPQVGLATVIFSAATFRTCLAYDPADTSAVYLATVTAAAPSSVIVKRVTPATQAVAATVTLTHGAAVGGISMAYGLDGGAGYLAIACSVTASGMAVRRLDPATLATSWTNATVAAGTSPVGVSLDKQQAAMAIYVAYDSQPGVNAYTFDAATGVNNGTAVALPYHTFAAAPRTVRVGGAWIPMLPVRRAYVVTSAAIPPTSASWVPDPAIEVYRACRASVGGFSGGTHAWYPVARVGVDMAHVLEGFELAPSAFSVAVDDDAFEVIYLCDPPNTGAPARVSQAPACAIRSTRVSLAAAQPQVAQCGQGIAVAACAIPLAWDGVTLSELCPTHVPRVTVATTGGANTLAAGTYLFAAVVEWVDAAGLVHRSPPSTVVAATMPGATSPKATVDIAPSAYNGYSTPQIKVILYMSDVGGSVLYAQNWGPTVLGYAATTVTFGNIVAASTSGLYPPIYSDGSATQELVAWCPGAARAAAFVGDRLWLVDAERPWRAYHSKPSANGLAPEMAAKCFVDFPAGAGNLVAISSMQEQPLFLGPRGAWTVDGQGPDALLGPPFFSDPRRVNDVPCTQALSVAKCPAGVIHATGNRFAMIAADGTRTWPGVDSSLHGAFVGSAVFPDQHEAVLFCADGWAYVYNWARDAWVLWDTAVTGASSIVAACGVPATNRAIIVAGDGTIVVLDPATVSASAQIVLETPWLVFDGPHGDVNLQNVVLRARSAGAHGVTVELATDYDVYQSAKVYSSSDVAALVGNGAYDLVPEPRDRRARAARVRITETGASGDGMQALSLTFEVTKNGNGKMIQAFKNGARK